MHTRTWKLSRKKRRLERTRPRWATLSIYNNKFLKFKGTISISTNLLHGLRGPEFLQVITPLVGLQQRRIQLWGDVSFKLRGQDSGKPLDGGVSVVHDGRRGVRAGIGRDDVP